MGDLGQVGFSQDGRPFPSAEYCETEFSCFAPAIFMRSGQWFGQKIDTMLHDAQSSLDEHADLIRAVATLVMKSPADL